MISGGSSFKLHILVHPWLGITEHNNIKCLCWESGMDREFRGRKEFQSHSSYTYWDSINSISNWYLLIHAYTKAGSVLSTVCSCPLALFFLRPPYKVRIVITSLYNEETKAKNWSNRNPNHLWAPKSGYTILLLRSRLHYLKLQLR